MFDYEDICKHGEANCYHSCVGCEYGIFACPQCKEVKIYPSKCLCEVNQEKEFYYD